MEPKNRNRHRLAVMPRELGPVSSPRTPEYFVDLTVDSPLVRHLRRNNSSRGNHNNHGAESSQIENPESPDLELIIDCSNRLLPPKKRSRIDNSKPTTVINLDDAMPSNETTASHDTSNSETNLPTCPVCLELLTSKRKPTSTRCGHIYCAECIEQTLTMSKKCPKCQANITQKSCIRLYF